VDVVLQFDQTFRSAAADYARLYEAMRACQGTFFDRFRIAALPSLVSPRTLLEERTDIFLAYSRDFHHFCFSHHVMDGAGFMVFCCNFYRHLGVETPRTLRNQAPHLRTFRSASLWQKLAGCATYFAGPLRAPWRSTPTYENPEHSFCFFSMTLEGFLRKKRPDASFNQAICMCIQHACVASGMCKRRLRFGVPVYNTWDSGGRGARNRVCFVYDDATLEHSRNELLGCVLAALLYILPVRLLPVVCIRWLVEFCLRRVDVCYSNIDARSVDDVTHLKSIAYMSPAFKETLFSFCTMTVKNKINVTIRSQCVPQETLDLFVAHFLRVCR
jgi:hypothetical protein